MAISNASRLADFGSGIGTDGAVLEVDNENKRIGLGTTNPNTTVQVGAVGASGTSLFVHGDSRILGVITATKFSGGWDGSLSVTDTTASTSTSTGALIISGGVGIAKSLFVGEGVSVAGTITYDDVTNIDSVGVVTAGKGVVVTGVYPITLGTGTTIHQVASNELVVGTNNLERFRVDSSGRVLIGHNANVGGSKLQANTTGAAAIEGISWYNGADATGVTLRKSRGGLGDFTIVQNGDGLGLINFAGADGNGWANGARIQAVVSGTPGDGDMPAALQFMTSADGTTNLTKRLTITPAGEVCATGIVTVGAGLTLSSDFINLTDNSKIQLGIGSDLSMWHNGSHSYIQNTTGTLYVKSKADETAMSINPDGGVDLRYDGTKKIETVGTGISVYGGMKIQSGLMRESVNIVGTALNSNKVINLSDGMVHYRSVAVGGANVKLNVISNAGINTDLAIGDAMTVQVMTVAGSTSHFVDQIRIDGVEASAGVTTSWVGGSVPSDGGGSGVDTYAFNILKTGNATYVVVANQVKTS